MSHEIAIREKRPATDGTIESLPRTYRPRLTDLVQLARFALPIVLIQVGMMSMGIVDMMVVGHLSATALAAVSLGNLFYFGVLLFSIGALLSLDPLVAQALGAKDHDAVSVSVQRGLVLSAVFAIASSGLLALAEPFFVVLRQPDIVVPGAVIYVRTLVPAVWPILLFVVLRQTLQAHRMTKQLVGTVISANVLNLILSICLVFGKLGLPALGVVGSALATLISRWFMAVFLLMLTWRSIWPFVRGFSTRALKLGALYRTMKVGAPIGIQMTLEWGTFSTVALMMGWLGVEQIGAHQVTVAFVSIAHTVAVGLGAAAAVVVGQAVGRKDLDQVRRGAGGSLVASVMCMGLAGAIFIIMPRQLAWTFTNHNAILDLAASLLPIAAVFLILDGLQVVTTGLLRGTGETRTPMLANLLGFWCLGLPMSLGLGFGLELGAAGLWSGLVLGMFTVAVYLLIRFKSRTRHAIDRLVVD